MMQSRHLLIHANRHLRRLPAFRIRIANSLTTIKGGALLEYCVLCSTLALISLGGASAINTAMENRYSNLLNSNMVGGHGALSVNMGAATGDEILSASMPASPMLDVKPGLNSNAGRSHQPPSDQPPEPSVNPPTYNPPKQPTLLPKPGAPAGGPHSPPQASGNPISPVSPGGSPLTQIPSKAPPRRSTSTVGGGFPSPGLIHLEGNSQSSGKGVGTTYPPTALSNPITPYAPTGQNHKITTPVVSQSTSSSTARSKLAYVSQSTQSRNASNPPDSRGSITRTYSNSSGGPQLSYTLQGDF